MIYSLEFTKKARKQLNKLPAFIQKRIILKLERIKIRPHSFVKRLVDSPYFRLRIGDYRALIKIEENILTILVVEVGPRKSIYK